MSISVIVPAHNEEKYLGETLKSIQRAKEVLLERDAVETEIIVVDNDSTDSTSDLASSFGVRVIKERKRNLARVRNAGANTAESNVLVFIDADTIVPAELLWRINQRMKSSACFGGAVDTDYQAAKPVVRIYLQLWRTLGKLAGMAQGATQFCSREVFIALRGYDESLYMGEDVDFHWRLKQFARQQSGNTCFINDVKVVPSTRRFDQWPLWRTLVCTNPVYVFAFRRREKAWRGWYGVVPR